MTHREPPCGWLIKTFLFTWIGGLLTVHTDMLHVALQEFKLASFYRGKKMNNNYLIWVLLTICCYSEGDASFDTRDAHTDTVSV